MKNRRFARFGRLAMTVMTAAALAFGTLAAAQPVMAEVITQDGVNIRLEASTEENNIIGSLNAGDHVEVLDSTTGSDGAEWYLVQLDNGNQGWVRADMVGEDPEEAPAQEEQQEEAPAQEEPEEEAPAAEETKEEEAAAEEKKEETPAAEEKTEEKTEEKKEEAPAAEEKKEDKAEKDNKETGKEEEAAKDTAQTDNTLSAADSDPATDPNTSYGLQYDEEPDGTGRWYVYNYDTGRKFAVSEIQQMDELNQLAEENAARAARYHTVLIILFILLLLLVLYIIWMLLRRGQTPDGGRPARKPFFADDDDDDDDDDGEDDEFDIYGEEDDEDEYEEIDDLDSGEDDEDDYEDDEDDEEDDEEEGSFFKLPSFFGGFMKNRGEKKKEPQKPRRRYGDFDEDEDYPEDVGLIPDEYEELEEDEDVIQENADPVPAAPEEEAADLPAEDEMPAPAPAPGPFRQDAGYAPEDDEDEDEDDMEYEFLNVRK